MMYDKQRTGIAMLVAGGFLVLVMLVGSFVDNNTATVTKIIPTAVARVSVVAAIGLVMTGAALVVMGRIERG